MSQGSLMHWQDQYQKSIPRCDSFVWNITGAVTTIMLPAQSGVLYTSGALTQATIDAFLASTTEFNYLAFDATSMGADTFAAIFNFEGQVQSLSHAVARCYSSSNTIVTRQVQPISALTNSSLATEVAVSSLGNIGMKIDFGNTPDFDGLTAGTIQIDLYWVSK